MKLVLILISLSIQIHAISLQLQQVGGCTCEMASAQTECIPTTCDWDSTSSKCTHKTCDKFTVEMCDQLPDYFKCAWKDSSCQAFTKCSDYSYSDGFKCFRVGPCQAVFKKNSAGLYPCTDKTNDSMHSIDSCAGINQEGCVETVQDDGKVCYWNPSSSACEAWSNSACSNFDNTSQSACPKFSCDYNTTSGKCTTRTCDLITVEAACTMVWDITQQVATQCKWVNAKCMEFDYSTLTQPTCLVGSNLSYKWNSSTSKCEVCVQPKSDDDTDDTSYSSLAQVVLAIVIFINI
ncbi:unnamed protein product (macronuclear) [Paramecium tetraurelia]|uniref:Mini antigen n=1 Tax=Paramecium tetraurelia TaxID=5888 RepID=A0D9W9_PARTE|nr:uncharacterized protein GSPATT00014768001 [Paramecium tetraurelia]CAK79836.1 unnamed protein product [Paramecium tetraurelia]|eukprot:XP_001447233.1 hypothetical protein (macronuclear) [Paramecium tetraurelia strain d4-2]